MKKKSIERIEYKDQTGDLSLDVSSISGDPWTDDLKEKQYDANSEHPTPEQLLIREATKYLTPKQKKVWELHNYDRFTQDEIAKKLGVRRTTIEGHIHRIEKRIAKWVKSNIGAYNLLKSEFGGGE